MKHEAETFCRSGWILTGLVLLSTFVSPQKNALAETWRAGVATRNITPTEPMWMAGYGGRGRPAEGKLTDLWAKALVLEDASGKLAVLVTLDLIGLDRTVSQSVCESLMKRFELKRDQIALCTSHTHTGPVIGRNLWPMHYAVIDADHTLALMDLSSASTSCKSTLTFVLTLF